MKSRSSVRKYRIAVTVLSLCLVGSLLSQCPHPQDDYPADQMPLVTETWSFGNGTVKAVRIPLTGVIAREREAGLLSVRTDPVETVLKQIRAAENDPEMKAVILEINSPGGGVTPSDEIHNALTRFRTGRADRRVVAFIRDMGASGAYYAAVAADLIIAEPTSVIGSIGVIMQTLNMEGLAEKIGISDVTIKSGENKDFLNPLRAADTNQIAILQNMIDIMQKRFVGLVSESRQIDPSVHPEIFDGRIFDATPALEKGLIDHIGYWDDAVVHTAGLFGTNDLYIIRYEEQKTFLDALGALKNPVQLPALGTACKPQFMYLWKP